MTMHFAIKATNRAGRTATIVQRLLVVLVIAMAACATLPPGSDYPKTPSTAFAEPAATRLGNQLAKESQDNCSLRCRSDGSVDAFRQVNRREEFCEVVNAEDKKPVGR